MAFSLYFAEDVDPVVIAEGPGHLVVVHGRMVLLDAPEASQSGRIGDFEDARFAVLPGDVVRVALARVVEQLLQEIPQQATVRAGIQSVARTASGRAAVFAVQRHRRHGRRRKRQSALKTSNISICHSLFNLLLEFIIPIY